MKKLELLSEIGFVVSAIGLIVSVIQSNHEGMIWWTILNVVACIIMQVVSCKQEKESLKYIKRY